MTLTFCATAIILVFIMLAGIVWMGRIKKDIVPSIRFLFLIAILTILSNVAAVLASAEWFATLTHGLYRALTDWLVVALFLFAKKYTGYFNENRYAVYIFAAISAIDTASLILNTFFHHVFSCVLYGEEQAKCYIVKTNFPGYMIHMILVYSMAIFVVALFLVKARKTLKMYRRKYDVILFSFMCVLAANLGYRFVDDTIDISVTFYILLAVAIAYFALLYVPKGLTVKLLSFAVKDMSTGIICYDLDGNCIYINEMAQKLFDNDGYQTDSDYKRFYSEWVNGRSTDQLVQDSWRTQRKKANKTCHYETSFNRLLDEYDNFVGSFFSILDITEEIEKYEKEHYRATHDPLTHILNRNGFIRETRKKLEEQPQLARYIICSDVKDFKLYNDMFGVRAGDKLLCMIANMMLQKTSDNVVCGRLAGDKFAMCIPVERYNEQMIADIIHMIAEEADTEVYHIHIQLGVYLITDPKMDISVMCDRAFIAINSIKPDYQKHIAYYEESLGNALQEEIKLLSNFDEAMETNQFQMYLQPQISADGKLLGAEALVRWLHPVEGLISPAKFIPLFERTGYVHLLDRRIWELACQKLREWRDKGLNDMHISVNISVKDFYYIDLYETFTGLVEKYGIQPQNLKLEITESAIMADTHNQLKLLDRLRNYGFDIEIDDFGSGYSSLNTLKDANVDVIKLDMGFLSKTEHLERSRIIINSIIAMSKRLGLTIITEGVEQAEQVEFLKEAGCDIFQGYYFNKPLSVKEFEERYQI